jgi:DNA primase
MPLEWDEIDQFSPDRPYTVATTPARLAERKRDPWRDYESSRQSLAEVIAALPSQADKGGGGAARTARKRPVATRRRG